MKIINVTEVYQWRWLEESGQSLENVDQTHQFWLEQASATKSLQIINTAFNFIQIKCNGATRNYQEPETGDRVRISFANDVVVNVDKNDADEDDGTADDEKPNDDQVPEEDDDAREPEVPEIRVSLCPPAVVDLKQKNRSAFSIGCSICSEITIISSLKGQLWIPPRDRLTKIRITVQTQLMTKMLLEE